MISDINLFFDEAKEVRVKTHLLHDNSVTLAFEVSKLNDKGGFNYEHERHEVTIFLSRAQLIKILSDMNDIVPKAFRNDQCGLCAGTGTMPVSDGETYYSGDDPCPSCDPIEYGKLYPVD